MGDDHFMRQFYLIAFGGEVGICRIQLEGDERLGRIPRLVRACMPPLVLAYLFFFASLFVPALVWGALPPLVWGVVAGVRVLLAFRRLRNADPDRHAKEAVRIVLSAISPVPAWVLTSEEVLKEGVGVWLEAELGAEAAEIARGLADGFDGTLDELLEAARALAA